MRTDKDFRIGRHLVGRTLAAAMTVLEFLREERSGSESEITGGGCQAFYRPEEWQDRGEAYGLKSVLILCHDGGDLGPYCDFAQSCGGSAERFSEWMAKDGFYVEQCTGWYSAVYNL